ncbi:MAG: aspartate aminotransferase family protein [Phycisphaerales bacterium]
MSASAPASSVGLDVRALLDTEAHDPLTLLDRHVNPAFASVLRTIGFDAHFTRGEGAYLFDDRGRRYIDCLGGYAVFNCGRNHPVVRNALAQALELDLPNLPGVGTFRVAGLLARELLAAMPGAESAPPAERLGKVFFASGGAEAIDAALKFARAATGRSRIIHCSRAYHGLTYGALSIKGNAEFRDGFAPFLEDVAEIPFNDLAALERELARSPGAAAFVVEPIQGKGVHIPASDYLREASRLCARHGALLVLDEIQTGMGRTGRMLACEHDGAGADWHPDIVVLAKGLSGGYVPVSAVLMKDRIHARTFSSMNACARIQNTFGMNDLAMVAGLAALHVMRRERLAEHAGVVGSRLLAGLGSMVGRCEMVKEVRGRGLMIAIEFQRPSSTSLRLGWDLLHRLDPSLFCQAIIMPLMSDHRIIAQVAAHRVDVIKLIPPLVLSANDADEIIVAIDSCVAACHRFPGPAWEVGKKLSSAAARRFAPM